MDFFKGFELQNGVMKAGVPGQRAIRARFGKAQSSPVTAGFLAIFLGATAMLPLCLEPKQALSQEAQLVKVDVTILAKGYRVSKLIGSAVTNDKNEKIGSIDDMIVDHKNILFAVLQVEGFLGLGAHLVAVPYDSLVLGETGKKVQLPGASKEQLKALSEFKYQA